LDQKKWEGLSPAEKTVEQKKREQRGGEKKPQKGGAEVPQ